uniref:Cytochrome P450 n=1 Tax=Arion vulgaris TaxID=1028688 RepID=A0A0B7BEC1_9EUPU
MAIDILTSLDLPPVVYIIVLLVVILIVKSWLQTPRNLPPCPVQPLPIIGHILHIQKRPRETLKEWRKKAGDVFSLYTGSKLTVVLNGYDVIKDTLVKQADLFSDRPDNLLNSIFEDGMKGIINASGHPWKEQRSVSLSILRNFGMGKNSLADKIQEEVSAYVDELGKVNGRPQEVRTLTNVAVSNVICSIIVGKRFEYNDSYLIRLIHILNEQVKLIKSVSFRTAFPWLRFFPGDLFDVKRVIQNMNDLMNHFCYPFIRLSQSKLNVGDDDDGSDSFITSYLKELKQKEAKGEPTTMDVSQLGRVIQNLFVAGSETTSTTMMWFMIYMLHYPNIQKKIFKEMNDVVGTDRLVSLQDKSQLNYLNAAIMETQRLASIVPLNLLHKCTAEVNVRGYTIPAGTLIMPNLDSVLHDEKTWGDPNNFRPERFLDNKGNLLHPEEFIPFSIGRRVCLGESLAKMELFLFLATMVQRFDLQPAIPDSLPPLKYIFGVTCAPEAFDIRFVERRQK